jgi:TolB-like protein/DNA-binding winged helix-turn-helix (wHTH) protein/Tfp pilus assembly protein PilF
MPESPQVERIRLADLTIDTGTRQVWRDGLEIPLTGLSYDLLRALIEVGTRVITTDELMERVWPGRVVNAETVAKRVELVREALGDNSQEPRYIALVRGRGYRLLHAPQPDSTRSEPGPGTTATTGAPRTRRLAFGVGIAVMGVLAVVATALLLRTQRHDEAVSVVATNDVPSIAVLPFLNLSEDAANNYISDGMAEELLGTLSKLPGLRVASRTSAFTFRGSKQSLPEIARQLNVDHIIEGSVRKAGNRIRVTVQLIDVRSDSHLWAENYDREVADVLDIQRDIAERIAGALQLKVSANASARLGAGTRNTEAWQLYLRGNQLWQSRTEEGLRQSIGLLGRAIELDPDFAQAHSSLAAAHLISFFWYAHPDKTSLMEAGRYAQRAIDLDPTLSKPYAIRAELAETRHEWGEAEALFREALRLNPNDTDSGYWYAAMLGHTGRSRDALAVLLRYEKLDPISAVLLHDIGVMYDRQGDVQRACEYYRRTTQLGSSPYPWLRVAECAEREGNLAAAEEAERTAERQFDFEKPIFSLVRKARTDPAAAREARAALLDAQKLGRVYFAKTFAALGDYDDAFDAMESSLLRGNFVPLRDLWWRDGAKLRAHPRFRPFVERIKLVEYWKKSGWPDVCRPVGDSFTCD